MLLIEKMISLKCAIQVRVETFLNDSKKAFVHLDKPLSMKCDACGATAQTKVDAVTGNTMKECPFCGLSVLLPSEEVTQKKHSNDGKLLDVSDNVLIGSEISITSKKKSTEGVSIRGNRLWGKSSIRINIVDDD